MKFIYKFLIAWNTKNSYKNCEKWKIFFFLLDYFEKIMKTEKIAEKQIFLRIYIVYLFQQRKVRKNMKCFRGWKQILISAKIQRNFFFFRFDFVSVVFLVLLLVFRHFFRLFEVYNVMHGTAVTVDNKSTMKMNANAITFFFQTSFIATTIRSMCAYLIRICLLDINSIETSKMWRKKKHMKMKYETKRNKGKRKKKCCKR